jgi:hypothetical protein
MIIDPDVEHLLIDHLNTVLPEHGVTIPVADRVPAGDGLTPAITLIRTGGTRRDLVTDEAQISIDVRAGDNVTAVTALNLIRALLNDLWSRTVGGHQVYTVRELSGPYSNPTVSEFARYSQSFLVAVRAAQVV